MRSKTGASLGVPGQGPDLGLFIDNNYRYGTWGDSMLICLPMLTASVDEV